MDKLAAILTASKEAGRPPHARKVYGNVGKRNKSIMQHTGKPPIINRMDRLWNEKQTTGPEDYDIPEDMRMEGELQRDTTDCWLGLGIMQMEQWTLTRH